MADVNTTRGEHFPRRIDDSIRRLVVHRETNFVNYSTQLTDFAYAVRSRLYADRPIWSAPAKVATPIDYPYGSVFNLEFSPLEDIAVAVCEQRAIQIFEPRTSSRLHVVPHAHEDGVNCVSFLDSFTFATCSDDRTIRLWDWRRLTTPMHVLCGHQNWVKNIEYDQTSGLLFSIAFYDGVRCWNLNSLDQYSQPDTDNLVLPIHNSVRMRLSKSKMFVSTRTNKCLVIDDFDASTLAKISPLVPPLLEGTLDEKLSQTLQSRTSNRPTVHIMSGLEQASSFRAVMSLSMHPTGEFIALRHMDVKNDVLQFELTSIYDLRETSYSPVHNATKTRHNYLKYIDEDSVQEALDYIKEISFSRDGRLLASPSGNGARLLALDRACTPVERYCDSRFHSEERAARCPYFEVVALCKGHNAPVLTCKFAQKDLLLATGCLEGRVLFHKPQL